MGSELARTGPRNSRSVTNCSTATLAIGCGARGAIGCGARGAIVGRTLGMAKPSDTLSSARAAIRCANRSNCRGLMLSRARGAEKPTRSWSSSPSFAASLTTEPNKVVCALASRRDAQQIEGGRVGRTTFPLRWASRRPSRRDRRRSARLLVSAEGSSRVPCHAAVHRPDDRPQPNAAPIGSRQGGSCSLGAAQKLPEPQP